MTVSAVLAVAVLAGPYLGSGGDAQAWVAEALSWGASQKRVRLPTAKSAPFVRYSTPYLRVASAAQEARRQGRDLDPASVPDKLTAAELHVFAEMLPIGSGERVIGMVAATGLTLMVAGEPLKPSSVDTLPLTMSVGALGGDQRKFEARELRAVFSLNPPIPAEARVIVEYSWVENGKPRRFERTCTLELRKTKW